MRQLHKAGLLALGMVLFAVSAVGLAQPIYAATDTAPTDTGTLPANTSSVAPAYLSPQAPTGLVAQQVGQTWVQLQWVDNPAEDGVTGYSVYQDGVKLGDTQASEYLVEGLQPGRSYAFYVTAVNDYDEGPASEILRVTTLPAPEVPTGLRVENLAATSVLVSWDGREGETFRVYLNGAQVAETGEHQYLLTGLEPTTGYTLEVSALANGQESAKVPVGFVTAPEPQEVDFWTISGRAWPYLQRMAPLFTAALAFGWAFLLARNLGRVFRRRAY